MLRGLLFALLCLSLAVWARASTEVPQEVHEVLWEAREEVDAGHLVEALKRLEAFRKEHPRVRHHLLSFQMGNICWRLGKKGEALRYWLEATKLKPEDAPSWQNLAKAYYEGGHFLKAAQAFLKAWKLTRDPELRFYGAVSLLKAGGRAGEALRHLKGLLEGHPARPDYWRALASLYLQRGEYLRAAAALEVALRFRDERKVREELAHLYQSAGLWVKAAKALERLHSDPSAEVCDRIASLYLMAGRTTEALKYLDLALSKDPTRGRFLRKGEILYRLRRYREAYDAFKLAASSGDDGYAHLMMGYCAWHLNDLKKAEEAFRRAANRPSYQREAQQALKAVVEGGERRLM